LRKPLAQDRGVVIVACVLSSVACGQCEALSEALEAARARNIELEEQVAHLEADRTSLRVQLVEALKLCELQQADLDRYKKEHEAGLPNHPERAPREQLQLAFERVLEVLGMQPPANDDDSKAEPERQPELPAGNSNRRRPKSKRRDKHGRRRLDLSNLPVIEQRIEPDEVVACGGEGFECIGQEVSERVALRQAEYVRYRIVRPKYVAVGAIVAEAGSGSGLSSASQSAEGLLEASEVAATGSTQAQSSASAEAESESEAVAPSAAGDEATDLAAAGSAQSSASDEAEQTCDTVECTATAAHCGVDDSLTDKPSVSILIAPLPEGVWPNVMGDPSAISHIIVSKYGDLLPLNRQQSMSARGGFILPKSTQCGWLKPAGEFCEPVVDAMFDEARKKAFVIATDATSASVLPPRRKAFESPAIEGLGLERRRCESWHVFVFIADQDHVVFRYDREHTGAIFAKMLCGYRGNLLADAASVFDVLYREHGMTEHCCWFHARRPFYRALETDPQRALESLSLIGKLFEVDRELRAENLDLDTFTRARAERAEPILKMMDDWVNLHRGCVDPRGPLNAAIGYYDNQREALHRFLKDGRIRLDNNLSEQALRNVVVGEANWIFFANETGIRWYTTFRSLIASCALHQLNPEIYLEQLLRLAPHWPRSRVLELSPKYWLETVARLDARHRAILERPWQPGVIMSAQIPSSHRPADISAKRAAA
jgi:transposase